MKEKVEFEKIKNMLYVTSLQYATSLNILLANKRTMTPARVDQRTREINNEVKERINRIVDNLSKEFKYNGV